MSSIFEITIYDFENICRTCLSREDLKPLYEKFSQTTCLVDMLLFCTFVKFAEDDGLPVKICIKCINEINQAFSFAKRCETTDTILRNCIKNVKTELTNNSSQAQKLEPTIKEEMQLEVMPEIILPNIHQPVEEVLGDYECAKKVLGDHECAKEVEQEDDSKIVFEEHYLEEFKEVKIEYDENVEEIKRIEDVKMEKEYNEIYDDLPVDETCEEDIDGNRDEIYGASFGQNSNLGLHNHARHFESKDGMYQCPTCKKCFKRFDWLNVHQMIHTGKKKAKLPKQTPSRNFQCTECDEAFTTKILLKQHSPIHGENKFSCQVCGKAFKTSGNFKVHKLIHTGEKPNVCSVCNKAFITYQCLQRHMRIHTGEKPYSCGVCSKAFTLSTSLKNHQRIHTGEKPYSCGVCSKVFTLSTSLTNHIRIHTGIKPHSCTACGKTFIVSSSLKNHMRIHTGEKPYSCKVCSRTFALSRSLKTHMRIHTD